MKSDYDSRIDRRTPLRDRNSPIRNSEGSPLRTKSSPGGRLGYRDHSTISAGARSTQIRRSEVGTIVNSLIDYINLERDLEKLKVSVALKEDFNLIDAFGLIDI